MRSIYYLWEAKRRLKACEEFIDLYGGEKECNAQILAQRDMIHLEVEYYRLGTRLLLSGCVIASILTFLTYITWRYS